MKLPELHLQRSFIINVPVDLLWGQVSNTQRVNRAVGMQPVVYTPADIGLQVETRFLGLPMRLKERPFEWVRNKFFQVERHYQRSAVGKTVGGVRLEPEGDGTRVTLFSDVVATNPVGVVAAALVFYLRAVARQKRLYEQIEQNYREHRARPFPLPAKVNLNEKRLKQVLEKLQAAPSDPALIQKLVEHLRTGHDDEVVKMRPYALADAWKAPRSEVLRVFLHGTRAGLLDMEWNVLCPNCRVTKGSFARLSELSKTSHCETCNIEYDVNFDQYVELRFSVNPQIREAIAQEFCINGPFMTPHVLVQLLVPPGERKEFSLDLEPGQYRLRTRPENGRVLVRATENTGETSPLPEITFQPGEVTPDQLELDARRGSLTVTNRTETDLLVLFEQGAWGQQGLSAAEVTSLQEFRDLFSSEVLTPGLGIEIRNLTFLFTDLKDSTALYERTGDNPAYAMVRDHFSVLGGAILKHQGALVKTIGDAVMAVFSNPQAAVAASLQIQQEIARLNSSRPDREPLVVKLGLHGGSCIAITANDILDYFGSTVNTAARVQGVSTGGDMVVTEAVLQSPGVEERLAGLPREEFEIKLKGFSQVFKLYRIWPVPEVWYKKVDEPAITLV